MGKKSLKDILKELANKYYWEDKAVLIGSRAAEIIQPSFYRKPSQLSDWDLIITPKYLLQWMETASIQSVESNISFKKKSSFQSLITKEFPIGLSLKITIREPGRFYLKDQECILDFEVPISMECSSALILRNTDNMRISRFPTDFPCFVAPLKLLISLKSSHLLHPIRWMRHIEDYHHLLEGKNVTLDDYKNIIEVRVKETVQIHGPLVPDVTQFDLRGIMVKDGANLSKEIIIDPNILKEATQFLKTTNISKEGFDSIPSEDKLKLLILIINSLIAAKGGALEAIEFLCTQGPCLWLSQFLISNYPMLKNTIQKKLISKLLEDEIPLDTSPEKAFGRINIVKIKNLAFEILPVQLNLIIFLWIQNPKDISKCSSISKKWQDFIKNPVLWHYLFCARWVGESNESKDWKKFYTQRNNLELKIGTSSKIYKDVTEGLKEDKLYSFWASILLEYTEIPTLKAKVPFSLQSLLDSAIIYDLSKNNDSTPQELSLSIALFRPTDQTPILLRLIRKSGERGSSRYQHNCIEICLKTVEDKTLISFDGPSLYGKGWGKWGLVGKVKESRFLSAEMEPTTGLPFGILLVLSVHLMPPSYRDSTIIYFLNNKEWIPTDINDYY